MILNDFTWPDFAWDAHFRAPRDPNDRYVGAGERPVDVHADSAFRPPLGTLADRPLGVDAAALHVASGEARDRKVTEHVAAFHAVDNQGRIIARPSREITHRPAISVDPKPQPDFLDVVHAVAAAAPRRWPVIVGVAIAFVLFFLVRLFAALAAPS